MKLSILPWLAVLVTTTAHGRIGETPAECANRYGKPSEFKGNIGTYSKDGFSILVEFNAGKAWQLSYLREDGKAFTPKQCEVLRFANSAAPWTSHPHPEIGMNKWYCPSSGLAACQRFTTLERLDFATPGALKRNFDERMAKEAASVSGL